MKNKFIIAFISAWLAATGIYAQQTATIKSFSLTTDHISANDRRNDYNGVPCALVKVQVVDSISRVEGKMHDILNKGVEKWVYMPKGSRNMKIHLKNYLPVEVVFRNYEIVGLESNRVYKLVIELPTNKLAEDAEKQRRLEEQRKYEEQKRKDELEREEQRKAERQQQLEKKKQELEEKQQQLEEQKLQQEEQRNAQEQQRLEQEKQRNAQEQQRLEQEKQRNAQEQQRLEQEKLRNAQEQQRLNQEQMRLEQKQRQQEEEARMRQKKEQQRQLRHKEFLRKMEEKNLQSVVLGIQGGVNIAQAHFGNSSGSTSSVMGLRLGFTAEFRLLEGFSLNTGLLYSGKGYKYVSEKNNVDEKGSAQYIDVPVLASARLPLGNALNLALNAGPYVALCVGGDVTDNWKGAQNYKKSFSSAYSGFDYGAQLGIGLDMAHHYHLGVSYQLGMAGSYSNRTLSFGLGYRF